MVIVYLPGSSLPAGKLNWPLSLLTTVVVMVEPSFLALTSTPSIMPSSVEETWPVRADAVCAWALADGSPAWSKTSPTPTQVASNKALSRILSSLGWIIGFPHSPESSPWSHVSLHGEMAQNASAQGRTRRIGAGRGTM